jgi:hypothetical protein
MPLKPCSITCSLKIALALDTRLHTMHCAAARSRDRILADGAEFSRRQRRHTIGAARHPGQSIAAHLLLAVLGAVNFITHYLKPYKNQL